MTGGAKVSARYLLTHAGEKSGIICFDEFARLFDGHIVHPLGASDDKRAQAQHVFDALRTFDETNVGEIWAQCPDSKGLGLAIGNRLKKAAGFHVEDADDGKIVIGITGGSFYFFLQNTAAAHTSAANVSILVSMSPILTVILAQIFSRSGERLGKFVYIGAVIAIAGVVLVVLNGTLSFHLSPLGDLLALAAALMWAVYSILVKRYTERYDNFLVTRRVFLWAFLTSMPLVLLTDGLPSLTPLFTQPNILISWLFLGVFGNAVCFAIWNIAFKRLGVVVTNNYLYASPFVTVVVGWLLLDEKISWMSILGAVLITLGVVFANKSTEK